MSLESVAKVAASATVILLGAATAVSAEPPPTTVVTHGYQFFGTVPEWPYALADAIARRAGLQGGEEGTVLVYQGSTGDLIPCQEVWCTADGTAHTVIVFDWANDSNEAGRGFSEAAAEALFAGLVSWSQEKDSVVDLSRLHLIGHSRGTVVNSEVAERLVAAGFPPPIQVTTLDPHDAGGGFLAAGQMPEGGLDDYDVNQEHTEYDCHGENSTQGVCAWEGTGYNDSYWQNDTDTGCPIFDPEGMELYGVSNFNQNDLESSFCHSDTHRWYLMTVDTDAATHPVTGELPGPDWYGTGTQCSTSPRSVPLARSADGYNLSEAGGGVANRCPVGPSTRQEVLFDFALSEGLVNGDFERIRDSGTESGWSFHGGSLNGSFGTDSTTYLILGGGQSALHNRFYLPTGVLGIQLCSKVSVASASDTVSMLLTSPSFPDRELLSADQQDLTNPSDWECFQAPILASEAGSIAQIQLSVTSQASPTVFFDDIQIIMSLFSDGFETGTTLPWSETIP